MFLVFIPWLLIIANALLRIWTTLHWNPLAFTFTGAPMAQWSSALAPLSSDPLTAIDPIFYPLWLSLVAHVTAGAHSAIGLYAGLMSVLTPWVWYRFLREALPSKKVALAGWALLGWLPSWIGIFSYLMPETLLLPLMGVSLWMTWRSLRKGTLESFVWSTLFWTACCLTKMTVMPLAVVCLVWLLMRQSAQWQRCVIVASVVVTCAIPLGYRAYKVLGVWAPFGYPLHNRIYMASGATTLRLQIFNGDVFLKDYKFTSASTQLAPFEPLSSWRSSRNGICTVQIHLERGAQDWKAAYEANKGPWNHRWRMQKENALFTLWGPSWPDLNRSRFWERLSYQNRWIWAPLLVGILVLNMRRFRKTRCLELLPLLTLVGWFFILIQPVAPAEGRYRKPFEGLLIANALWMVPRRRWSWQE